MLRKTLSVCAVVLAFFFGLRLLVEQTSPQPSASSVSQGVERELRQQDDSPRHLASLASIAAGVLAFAVIPGKGKRSILMGGGVSGTRRAGRPYSRSRQVSVRCPHCASRMRRSMVSAGEHRGRAVWLCPQSPACGSRPPRRRTPATLVGQVTSRMVGRQVTLS